MTMKTTLRRAVTAALIGATALSVAPAGFQPAAAMTLPAPAQMKQAVPSDVITVSSRGRRNTAVGVGVALGVLGIAAAAAAAERQREREYYYDPGPRYYGPAPGYYEPAPRYYEPRQRVYVVPDDEEEVYYVRPAPRVAQPRGAYVSPKGQVRPGKCWIETDTSRGFGYWGRC
jgi:hypothetical protein